jgi:DNA-binding NarL/FixJ family response regulator
VRTSTDVHTPRLGDIRHAVVEGIETGRVIQSSSKRLDVLLVDPDRLARMGLETVLAECRDVAVVGEATDAVEAVAAARRLRPAIVVRADDDDAGAAECFRELAREEPTIRTLVIGHDDPIEVHAAFSSGAAGFLLRSNAPDQLERALVTLSAGERFLDPEVGGRLAAGLAANAGTDIAYNGDAPGAESLTLRERQVLTLLARGLTSAEIGTRLGISARTVDRHRTSLGKKLGRHRRSELVAFARDHHLD